MEKQLSLIEYLLNLIVKVRCVNKAIVSLKCVRNILKDICNEIKKTVTDMPSLLIKS